VTNVLAFDFATAAVWCLALTTVSAIVPWVNAEVIVLSLPTVAGSVWQLLALVMVATAGQMLGKCVVYWAGRRGAGLSGPKVKATLARWRARTSQRPAAPLVTVLVSSTISVPPFYLMSLVAGAIRMPFGRYLVAGSCGRLLRFCALAFSVRTFASWLA